jgi:hypothetical protein
MAFFHRGLIYECHVLAPLTIEGRRIRVNGNESLPALHRLAKRLIDDSPEYVALRKRGTKHKAELDRCRQRSDGRRAWRTWRRKEPGVGPFLAKANLDGWDLSGFDLSYANLTHASMRQCKLRGANFHHAILSKANLDGADLTNANMCATDLYQARARGARFIRTNLQGVHLVETDVTDAWLEDCAVYGLSAWDVKSTPKVQKGFRIKFRRRSPASREPDGRVEDEVIVDNLEAAHFTYSALHNANIGRAISAAGSSTVLLLGRFSNRKRRAVLEELREVVDDGGYIPMIFDFKRPRERDLIETIKLLAGLSLFVIADVSDPRSTPQELEAIAPSFQVPIVPIVQEPRRVFSTFAGLMKYPWVLPPLQYDTVDSLRAGFRPAILAPALALSRSRIKAREREVKSRHIREFLSHRR